MSVAATRKWRANWEEGLAWLGLSVLEEVGRGEAVLMDSITLDAPCNTTRDHIVCMCTYMCDDSHGKC